jgi:hypothetical protein
MVRTGTPVAAAGAGSVRDPRRCDRPAHSDPGDRCVERRARLRGDRRYVPRGRWRVIEIRVAALHTQGGYPGLVFLPASEVSGRHRVTEPLEAAGDPLDDETAVLIGRLLPREVAGIQRA